MKRPNTPKRVANARRTNWLAAVAASALSLGGATSCGQGPGAPGGDPVAHSAQELTLSGTSILGFESPAGWLVVGGLPSSTTVRTQGNAALAIAAPLAGSTLTSAPLSSGLAPLAALSNAGSSIAVDLLIPTQEVNPHNFGTLQLLVSSPSHLIVLEPAGQVSLNGQVPGTFQTYTFSVPSNVRSQLSGSYSDLTFTLVLQAPLGSFGTYVFDNLRTQSPSTQQVGALPSENVTATVTQSPAANTPGQVSFPPGTIQIPQSFFVNVGDAGTGTATFQLALGSTTTVSCTYAASSDATSYVFSSCSTGNVAGDIVAATSATLAIVSADPAAPTVQISAQLAYDLLQDQVGTKLVPPVPTYWGQTVAQINSISQAFAQAQANALPPQQRYVSLPIPNFALRQGNGSPVNALTAGATGSDPPFDFKGDLNNGAGGSPSGLFDAYYEVNGNVSATENNNTFTSQFNATGTVGVVVLGDNVSVLKISTSIDTNNGGTSASGSENPTSTATFQAYLFGQQFLNQSTTQQTGFNFNPTLTQTFDTPPIPIWIFSIQGGVGATVGVDFTGNLAINGFQLTATPSASVNANVQGGVNIGVASGGVDVTIQLVAVSLPVVAQATFNVNTDPSVCAASFNASINGSVKLTSGGGNVALDASIGVCPVCYSDSWTIFNWNGLNLGTVAFPAPFPITINDELFTLPTTLCRVPLVVNIQEPTGGTNEFAGIAEPTSASANRQPVSGQLVGDSIPCSDITWTSSDPGATFSPSATGCSPTVTFSAAAAGTSQTLTAAATDQFGETGSTTVTVNVVATPTGPVPVITQPQNGEEFASFGATLAGNVTGGTGTITAVWSTTSLNNPDGGAGPDILATQTVTAGTSVPIGPTTVSLPDGTFTVVLTVTDSSNESNTAQVTFVVEVPQ
jgi:hypothetical protein